MSKKKIVAVIVVLFVGAFVVQAVRVRGIKKKKRMEEVQTALDLADRARTDGRFATAVGQYENALKALQPLGKGHQELQNDIQGRIQEAQGEHVEALFAKVESEREAGQLLSALGQIALAGNCIKKYGSRFRARGKELPGLEKEILDEAKLPALERTRATLEGGGEAPSGKALFRGILDERLSGYSAEYEYREDKFLPGNKIFERIRSLQAYVALRLPGPEDEASRSQREESCRALLGALEGAGDTASRADELNALALRVWKFSEGSLGGPCLIVKLKPGSHKDLFERMNARAVEDIKGDFKPPWQSTSLRDTLVSAGMGTPEQVEEQNREVAEDFRSMAKEVLDGGGGRLVFVAGTLNEMPEEVKEIFKELPKGVTIKGYMEEQ